MGTMPDRDGVEVLTDEEFQATLEHDLREIGFTLAELEEQGRTGEFSTDCARRLWAMVKPIAG